MIEEQLTPFEIISQTTLHRLVDTFYGPVAENPELAPIFPNDLSLQDPIRDEFFSRLTLTDLHMINTPDDDETGDV